MSFPVDIIERKRDGGELDAGEIAALIAAFCRGEVPDYQMSAWLMAVYFRGLAPAETLALTAALIASGERLDLSPLKRRVVDKHSTGGVGDKVTLVLGPVVAACGAVFGKMSGRSLGHTGGTADKLEAIPGYRLELDAGSYLRQLQSVGLCVAGQSGNLVPADKRLYALRDVTATVDSNPLIAASIMSKKIAGGAGAVVLDVKIGRGGFFANRGQAAGAVALMRQIGQEHGIVVEALLTAMDQPLGSAVGNSLEVLEAVAALRGQGPDDLNRVVLELAARMLFLSDLGWESERCQSEAQRALSSGAALAKFRQWIKAQGGDARFIEEPDRLPLAPQRLTVAAPAGGFVTGLDAHQVGCALLKLGAGRLRLGEAVDHGVGAVFHRKIAAPVSQGERLATVYAGDLERGRAAAREIAAAYTIGPEPVAPPPLFLP